ncbi:MAG: response regulator [Candidatus Coatesbacteria bacterium]|nr:response regulator [Candidatus Coatesbacteria bacterium]
MSDRIIDLSSEGNGNSGLIDIILMVEDEPDHAELVVDALRTVGNIKKIVLIENGETALDYIFRKGKYEDKSLSPRPGLILLDINLPGKNGLDVLKIIRREKRFSTIPIVILTTSPSIDTVKETADLGANDYVIKPSGCGEFLTRITGLGRYWSTVSALPIQKGIGQ